MNVCMGCTGTAVCKCEFCTMRPPTPYAQETTATARSGEPLYGRPEATSCVKAWNCRCPACLVTAPEPIHWRAELRDLVLGLYADDKQRQRHIRRAAQALVAGGEVDERIVRLSKMIDP